MSGGGGEGNAWAGVLALGLVVTGAAYGLGHAEIGPGWLEAALLAAGGLMVVFGSCEAMIKSVEGFGARARWNRFVAGTIAGLASNLPEVVMLAFVVMAAPRVAFIVVMLTLHVNALAFALYSLLLPRDETGQASLPAPLVHLSTDLYATACGVFISTGALMLLMYSFGLGHHGGRALAVGDLYAIGAVLLLVEVVAVVRLVKRFSQSTGGELKAGDADPEQEAPAMSTIIGYGVLGMATSVVGGHAVGEFAEILVAGLTERGYSEMVGAIILSLFAGSGAYAMILTSHAKGMHEIALASVSGAVTQVPFVVLPITLICIAAFAQTGVTPLPAHGGALAIDMQTTAVLFLAFPTMLIMWKSIQDDGAVNWVESAGMTGLFGLTMYFLAVHG